jgi:hypothetical protein
VVARDLVAIVRSGEAGGAAVIASGHAPAAAIAPGLLPPSAGSPSRRCGFLSSLIVLSRGAPASPDAAPRARRVRRAGRRARAARQPGGAGRRPDAAPRGGRSACGPHVVGAASGDRPAGAARRSGAAPRRALRELAHVRRRDALGRAISSRRALFWFLPVVHLASRALGARRRPAMRGPSRRATCRAGLRPPAAPLAQLRARRSPPSAPRSAAASPPCSVPARARLGWVHRVALLAWVTVAGGARTAAPAASAASAFTPELAGSLLAARTPRPISTATAC